MSESWVIALIPEAPWSILGKSGFTIVNANRVEPRTKIRPYVFLSKEDIGTDFYL